MSSSHFDDFKQKYTNLQVELNYNQNLNFVGYSYFFNRKLIGLTEIVMWKTQPEVLGTPCTIFPHTINVLSYRLQCKIYVFFNLADKIEGTFLKKKSSDFFMLVRKYRIVIEFIQKLRKIMRNVSEQSITHVQYNYVTCYIYPSSLFITFTLRLTSRFKKYPNLEMSIKSWLRFLVTIKISAFSWLNGI